MGAVAAMGLEELRALAERTRPLTIAKERILPVRADLAALLPFGGLRRGTVVEAESPALVFALLGAATAEGSWVAFVGAPSLGLAAAVEHGIDTAHLAVVAAPPFELAATVVAALVDALDAVVLGPRVVARPADARRLAARARERGSVLLSMGGWPEAVDLRVRTEGNRWDGLQHGVGHLQHWSSEVVIEGRGVASRARRSTVVLVDARPAPRADGGGPGDQRADDHRATDDLRADDLCTDDRRADDLRADDRRAHGLRAVLEPVPLDRVG